MIPNGPTWQQSLQLLVMLSIFGFVAVILSYWYVLPLLLLAGVVWLCATKGSFRR